MNPKVRHALDHLLTAPQYILPHHLLSRAMHYLTRAEMGKLSEKMIDAFIRLYGVDMEAAMESDPAAYENFNAFFTRALKPESRPIAPQGIISPVDGTVSQAGKIHGETLFQAKGYEYTLTELFGGFKQLANLFADGVFCTLYLSPKDYHRIHMPVDGHPLDMVYVPGRLFSVNQRTTEKVPRLFTRNERAIALFKSSAGPMAVVMVGAMFVGNIETVWEGCIVPSDFSKPQRWELPDNAKALKRGEEMGRFNMGSTVILLFDSDRAAWLPELAEGYKLQMGSQIGQALQRNKG